MLRPAPDNSQADWLLEHSATESPEVQSYVSARFAAYARFLLPANGFDGAPVRWSRIAQEVGFELSAEAQWSDLAVHLTEEGELINLDAPEWSPDPATARALTKVLGNHTSTADCYYLIWEGYAGADAYFSGLGAPKIATSQIRTLFLLTGSPADACQPIMADDRRLPNWWWPADHGWCVGNEIYARSVFVGGSKDCIDAVMAHPALEAYPILRNAPVFEELD